MADVIGLRVDIGLLQANDKIIFLWSPYGMGQTIIFLPCGFFFFFFLLSLFLA